MIDALFNQSGYVAAQKMLDMAALRHQAISSNIANLETPGYKRMDIAPGFRAQLQSAIKNARVESLRALQPSLKADPTATAATRDGNTVKLDHELLQLTENQVAHTLQTQLVTASLLKLRLAITGRPS